jgi:hypothetical protein
MRRSQSPKTRLILVLLLLPVFALGPIGCGAEAVPLILPACAVAGTIAFTIHEIQTVQGAYLDNEMKQIRLEGMRNGRAVRVDRPLSDDEHRMISDSGKVSVNGREVSVGLGNERGFTPRPSAPGAQAQPDIVSPPYPDRKWRW